METTIYRTLKSSQMIELFEKSDVVNIKFYNASNYTKEDKKYRYEIVIRHEEGTNGSELFDEAFDKMFSKKKEPKKKVFLVSTERGRKRGRISFYIAEIVENKGLRLVDNDFTCSVTSNRGTANEVINFLVDKEELPKQALDKAGYRNGEFKDYILILLTGTGLNYVEQIN